MNNSWIPFSCFSLRVLELSVCHITLKQSYFYTDMSQEAHLRLTGKQNRWHKQMSRLLSEWLIFVNQRRWIKSNWFIIIYNWVWLFFCSHRKILGMNTCGSLTVEKMTLRYQYLTLGFRFWFQGVPSQPRDIISTVNPASVCGCPTRWKCL